MREAMKNEMQVTYVLYVQMCWWILHIMIKFNGKASDAPVADIL